MRDLALSQDANNSHVLFLTQGFGEPMDTAFSVTVSRFEPAPGDRTTYHVSKTLGVVDGVSSTRALLTGLHPSGPIQADNLVRWKLLHTSSATRTQHARTSKTFCKIIRAHTSITSSQTQTLSYKRPFRQRCIIELLTR